MKTDYVKLWFLYKNILRISANGILRNYQNLILLNIETRQYPPHY